MASIKAFFKNLANLAKDADDVKISDTTSPDDYAYMLAKAYHALKDSDEGMELAANYARNLEANDELIKSIPFEPVKPKDDFQFQEYDEKLLINQLYSSDIRPSGISSQTLRTLSFRSTLLSQIIARRVNQMETFAVPQKSKYDLGFVIEPRSGEAPTLRQKEDIKRLQQAIMELGFMGYDPLRGSFKDFIRFIIQDSLICDGASMERVWSKAGTVAAFKAIDGGCIIPRFNPEKGDFEYQEYIEGILNNTFDRKHLVYSPRNKTTDRRWLGFGISEIERTMNTITSHLFAEEYNKRLFKSGHFINGIVNLKGQISRAQFQEFKRDFYAFLSGVENTNKVALINAPQGAEFTSAIKSPTEMGFTTFMDYMVKVVSSVFMMDPVEINFFITGNTGSSTQTQNLSSQEFRLKYSKDSGLRPLLSFVEDFVNHGFLETVTDEYELKFRGLDEDDKKSRLDYLIKAKEFMTLNEVRATEGLPPIEGPRGEIVKDQGYMQVFMNELQANKEAETPDMPGQESSPEEEAGMPAENREKIESFLDENGYTEEEKKQVLDAVDSGALSWEEFVEITGFEEPQQVETSPESEEEPSAEEPPTEETTEDETQQ